MTEEIPILQLVKRAKAGDQAAFGELYELFSDRIFRFIRIKVSHSQEAEDILQTVFVKAWHGLKGFNLAEANFSAWLYKIAANAAYDHYRKVARQPQNLELNENIVAETHENAGADMDVYSEIADLKKKFELLPPQYKEVLELRFVRDFTLKETAEILKKNNLSVRLLQHRALKKLKTLL